MSSAEESRTRSRIHRQAASIVAAVAPFAIVFGAAAATAGLTLWETTGFSLFVFAGSAQFAAVEILGDGGSVGAAALAGLLLNVRSLAFGVIMAPALAGVWWKRAGMSQLMIDESTAVGSAQSGRRWQRYGYLVTGIGVFVVWNTMTVVGHVIFSGAEDVIHDLGLDAAGPAAFLALLWPRLSQPDQRVVAILGAVIAVALVPLAPPGVPILASMLAVLAAPLAPRSREHGGPSSVAGFTSSAEGEGGTGS